MKNIYEQPIIEITQLIEGDVLTGSNLLGGTLPGDKVIELELIFGENE